MRVHKLFAALAVVALVALFLVAPLAAAPASAVVEPPAPDVSVSDAYIRKMTQPTDPTKPRRAYAFTPSSSKLRAVMLNITGSMLGQATPGAWQAETIANSYKRDHSWELMEQQFSARAPSGVPDSYQDHVLAKHEYSTRTSAVRNAAAQFAAPATAAKPTSNFRKGVAGVGNGVLGLTAMPLGFQAGTGIAQMFGFDANGQVCQSDLWEGAIAFAGLVNGVDCDAWAMTQEAIAAANADAHAGISGGWACAPTDGATCIRLAYQGISSTSGGYIGPRYCFEYKPSTTAASTAGIYITSSLGDTAAYQPSNRIAHPTAMTSVCPSFTYQPEGIKTVAWLAPNNGRGDLLTYKVGTTGVPAPVVQATNDPERYLTCTVVGDDGITYTADSEEPYRESEGKVVAPQCPGLPAGVMPLSYEVDDGMGNTLFDEPTTDAYQDWYTRFPDCRDGSCALDLLRWDSTHTSVASCFDLEQTCMDWMQDPAKIENYECRYGGNRLDLTECYVYSGTFDPERVAIGAGYSDPETGTWSGGQNSPVVNTMGNPVQNPDGVRNCLSNGYGAANPIEWVLLPVKCAMEWAFVPRAAVIGLGAAKLGDQWEDTPPAKIGGLLTGFAVDTSVSGCAGLPIELPFEEWLEGVVAPLGISIPELRFGDACPGSLLELPAVAIKLVLGALMTWATFTIVSQQVGAVANYRIG